MKEDEDYAMDPAHRAEVEAAERIKQEVADAAADPATQGEWIRQSNLMYSGLAAAGLVMVQPFLTETSSTCPRRSALWRSLSRSRCSLRSWC